jgi:hypothetical protein
MIKFIVRLGGNQSFCRLSAAYGLLATAVTALGCGAAGAQGPNAPIASHRDTDIHHEACDIASSHAQAIDANNDGRADLTIVMDGGRQVCRAADLDFDGRVDVWTYYDASGNVSRREFAFDRDGSVDEIQVFSGGQLVEKQRASTLAHRIDTWEKYAGGRIMSAERDSNGDGRVDQWWDYKTADCPIIRSDTVGNGQADPNSAIDYCKESNYKPQEQIENNRPEMLKKETDALPTETSNTEVPAGGAKQSPDKPAQAPQADKGSKQ